MSVKIGKLGIVRLTGKDLAQLRIDCFQRDKFTCQECGIHVTVFTYSAASNAANMAHIQSRGAGGSDVISNVQTLCHLCHMKEHNAGGKPCLKK